jgi:hypothetical protein
LLLDGSFTLQMQNRTVTNSWSAHTVLAECDTSVSKKQQVLSHCHTTQFFQISEEHTLYPINTVRGGAEIPLACTLRKLCLYKHARTVPGTQKAPE